MTEALCALACRVALSDDPDLREDSTDPTPTRYPGDMPRAAIPLEASAHIRVITPEARRETPCPAWRRVPRGTAEVLLDPMPSPKRGTLPPRRPGAAAAGPALRPLAAAYQNPPSFMPSGLTTVMIFARKIASSAAVRRREKSRAFVMPSPPFRA